MSNELRQIEWVNLNLKRRRPLRRPAMKEEGKSKHLVSFRDLGGHCTAQHRNGYHPKCANKRSSEPEPEPEPDYVRAREHAHRPFKMPRQTRRIFTTLEVERIMTRVE